MSKLTAERSAAIYEAITKALELIGTSGETAMPKSTDKRDVFAWEMFVVQVLGRLVEARKRAAIKQAIAAGVIFNPELEQRPSGTNAVIYQSDLVQIGLTVSSPVERVDHGAWVSALLAQRPRLATLAAVLTKNYTKAARAAHSFAASLVTAGA